MDYLCSRLIIAFLLVGCAVAVEPEELPSNDREIFDQMGYVGLGYNPYTANPHARTVDPGFAAPLFDVGRYERMDRTTNRNFLIPAGVDAIEQLSCSTGFESEIISDAKKFEKSLSAEVEFSLNVVGAPFSASADYRNVVENMKNRDSVFLESTASCELYVGRLELFNLPPRTMNFEKGVNKLPTVYNADTKEKYMDFFKEFGTHVTIEVAMGARVTVRQELSKSSFSNLLGSGLNMEAAASVTAAGGAVSAEGKAFFNINKDQLLDFNSSCSSVDIFATGKRLPPKPEKISEWLNTPSDDTSPVRYSLAPISLFVGFRSEALRDEVHKASKDFCSEVKNAICEELHEEDKIQPLCPQPKYSKKWTTNRRCIIDSMDKRNKMQCEEGMGMASVRAARSRLFSSKGVQSAFHNIGCVKTPELGVGTPSWRTPVKKGNNIKIECEENYYATGLSFAHYCFKNMPGDEFASLQCSRSKVKLGQCTTTEWTNGVRQPPSWDEATCPGGTLMTGIEFRHSEGTEDVLGVQEMRLTCCVSRSDCIAELPSQ